MYFEYSSCVLAPLSDILLENQDRRIDYKAAESINYTAVSCGETHGNH